MSRVLLDYDTETQDAIILALGDDCDDIDWNAVEEIFRGQVGVSLSKRKIRISWAAFLCQRSSFTDVVRWHKIDIEKSETVDIELKKFANKYKASQDLDQRASSLIGEDVLQSKLNEKGFIRNLLPYQLRNVSKLTQQPSGASFSVPGSGKTTEALALFTLMRLEDEKLLIVCPKNAFQAWEKELPKCLAPVPSVERLTCQAERVQEILADPPDVMLINYERVYRPQYLDLLTRFLFNYPNCLLVLDESHRMKGGEGNQTGRALLRLSTLPRRKLVLSGTPMPNDEEDLVAQFNFLFEGRKTVKDTAVVDFKPFFVRTTKKELKLPPVNRYIKPIELLPSHQRFYDLLTDRQVGIIAGLDVNDRGDIRNIAKCVQYLLMAASNPSLLWNKFGDDPMFESVDFDNTIPNKMQYACSEARRLVDEGKKVLIWSTFKNTINQMSRLLKDVGAEHIHGEIPTDEDESNLRSRENIIDRFNNMSTSTKVLIANPASCSEAISLHHSCHDAIYVDRNYNAGQFLQSEDRIHRIGLPEYQETNITILSTPGSIDESVTRRLEYKVGRMSAALEDPGLTIKTQLFSPSQTDTDGYNSVGIDNDDVEDIMNLLFKTKP